MKICPKCNLNYSDDSLEFCLEDGARLTFSGNYQAQQPTVTIPNRPTPQTDKTVDLNYSNPIENIQNAAPKTFKTSPQTDLIKEKVAEQSNKVLEVAPITISLAHNWWQWVYLNNQYYSTFSAYFLSANFLMWMLLLVGGSIISLFALKRSERKGFAITSLVILAVNLILFLVPRR